MNFSKLAAIATTLVCLLYTETYTNAAGARLLSDLNPGPNGSYSSNFTSFGDSLFFSAYTLATGFELFRTDGTSVTLVEDINPTADDIGFGVLEGNDSLPSWLTVWDNQLFFSAYEPRRGAELWRYDSASATRISDIAPDINDTIKVFPNNAWPAGLTLFSNVLYFSATTSSNVQNYELWSYDGSTVREAANIQPDTGTNYSSYPHGFTLHNGEMYFTAYTENNGWELYRFVSGTPDLIDINPGGSESSSYPKDFVSFGDELFFPAYTDDKGYELWKVKQGEVTALPEINPGPASSYPQHLIEFNGSLYFSASDGLSGAELWRYDGTTSTLAADINNTGDSYPKNLAVFNGRLIFAANDGIHGWELWSFNGDTATLITDLNSAGDAFPEELTVLGEKLFFTATTPQTGYEVFLYDGVNVTAAADVNFGPGDSFPRHLYVHNGALYFTAADTNSNWEIWVIDGNDQNLPPTVSIVSPASGSTFLTSDVISVTADASDDAAVAKVEFFANEMFVVSDSTPPYSTTMQLPAGSYSLLAKVFDTLGLTASSAPVEITVQSPSTNTPPAITSVSITQGDLSFSVAGDTGTTFTVHASTDLLTWEPIATGTVDGGVFRLSNPIQGTSRFFRISIP